MTDIYSIYTAREAHIEVTRKAFATAQRDVAAAKAYGQEHEVQTAIRKFSVAADAYAWAMREFADCINPYAASLS